MKKSFNESISEEMKDGLKRLNKVLKQRDPDYQFRNPPHEISVVWEYSDWCDWIDGLWQRRKEKK